MARLFDDNAANYLVNTAGSPVTGAGPWTMACWAKAVSLTFSQTLGSPMSLGRNAALHLARLMVSSTGALTFQPYDGANGACNASGTMAAGRWDHLVGVKTSAASQQAFLNGAAGTANTTSVTPTLDRVSIGISRYTGTQVIYPWDGYVAWPAVWNVALSQAEITALAKGAHPYTIRPGNLIAFWPLTGAVDSGEQDFIGALDLSEVGTVGVGESRLITVGGVRAWSHVVASGVSGTIGLTSETDAALAITALRTRAIGLSTETDTALAISAAITHAIGLATETDAAFAMAPRRTHLAGLATETDSGLSFTPLRLVAAGLAAELDSALSLTGAKLRAIGLAGETDSALDASPASGQFIGLAGEADAALAMGAAKAMAVALANEADGAFAFVPLRAHDAGLAGETGAALPFDYARGATLGLATEADAALGLVAIRLRALGLAAEADSAFAIVVSGPETVPTSEGLQFTAPIMRLHYRLH